MDTTKTRRLDQPRILTLANALTVSRVLLIPFYLRLFAAGRAFAAVAVIVAIGATDFFDGRVARRTGTAGKLGAIFDVTADCAVVFAIQAFLCLRGTWPPALFALSLLSVLSFLFAAPVRGGRGGVGRYTGAALMSAIGFCTLVAAIRPEAVARTVTLCSIPCALIAVVSILENLASVRRGETCAR